MATLQWQFTMSLDGFMAGPDGDMSWMKDHLEPDPTVDELMGRTGALLVGNRTFRGDDPFKDTPQEGEPYGGGWSGPQFVLTHHAPETPVAGVTFVGDLDSGVAAASAAAGESYVGVLGADIGRQCLEAGLLDEIFVSIVPVLLGDGVRMYDHPGGNQVRLERIKMVETPGKTDLWLRVVR
jgi:dihydrofolate reductase